MSNPNQVLAVHMPEKERRKIADHALKARESLPDFVRGCLKEFGAAYIERVLERNAKGEK